MVINVNDLNSSVQSRGQGVGDNSINHAQSLPPIRKPKTLRMRQALLRYGTQGLVAITLGLGSIGSIGSIGSLGIGMVSSGTAQAAGLADLFNTTANQAAPQEFLSVDKAFTVVPMQNGNTLTLSLEITPQYYLYKDKFSLRLPAGITASPFVFSQTPHSIDDPNFGKVPIFDQNQVMATATLTNTTAKAVVDNAVLTWQGCAKAGLCYPPQRQNMQLTLPASATTAATNPKPNNKKADTPLAQRPTPNSDNNSNSNDNATAKAKASSPDKHSATKSTAPAVTASGDGVKAQKPAPSSQPLGSSKVDANHLSTKQKVDNNRVDSASTPSTPAPSSTSATTVVAGQTNAPDSLAGANLKAATAATEAAIVADDYDNYDNYIVAPQTLNAATATPTQYPATTPDPNSNNANLDDPQSGSNATIQLGNVVDQDPFGLAEHPLLALLLLFIAGLGLSFTACVLPMLPIVSNIIARQHQPTAKKGLLLSGSYALGVAFAYGLLGAAIAVFGKSLGIIGWLQSPIVLLGFAAVFTVLALYMLELFTIHVPRKLKQKMHTMSQAGDRYLGSSLGSFLVGMLSALVVSPCVSAPLLGALLAVSTIGNPLLGFAALFMLGFGVSAPLMLLGVSQGNLMPKAGAWMHWIKQGFALMLFAVALLLVERVFISTLMLIGWAIWFAVVAGWAWQWQGRGKQFTRAIACVLAVWSACVLVGAAAGSRDAWQPLAVLSNVDTSAKNTLNPSGSPVAASSSASTADTAPADIRITSLPSLTPILAQYPKVLVDVTADWCVECRIMDKTLFTQSPSQLQAWQVVKLDITESNADTQQVLEQLRLFGPPALLYFVNGELKQQQVGAIDRDTFEQTLAAL